MAKTIESTVLIMLGPGMGAPTDALYATGDDLSFRYDSTYTISNNSFDLFPSMPRSSAPFSFSGLGPFSDSAPDRWDRRVFSRDLKQTRVNELEYLFGVNDLTGQGTVRFVVGGKPTTRDKGVPVLSKLPELLNTTDTVEQNHEVSDVSLRRLYRAAGSLGDARPKASISDHNALWLAKLPKPNGNDWDVVGWEAVTLEIASMAGIKVPEHHVIAIEDSEERSRTMLLTRRFDRVSAPSVERMERLPYVSAMTALEARDGGSGDWLDLAEFTRKAGGDTIELWQGTMFSAAIDNTDDHLRNHRYLHRNNSWQLAPAFNMNPEPFDPSLPGSHQVSLLGDTEVDIDKLMSDESLSLFGMSRKYTNHWLPTLRSALSQALSRAVVCRIDIHSINLVAEHFDKAVHALQ